MPVVALNRRFIEWDDQEPPDPEVRRAFGLGEEGVGWDELLLKRRVVILAEAGSGKSTEMAERAWITAASGRYAFYATVEDVGRESLKAWRASTDVAWFFIDSVDEAKNSGIRLEKVVRGWQTISMALKNARTSSCRAELPIGSFARTWSV